MIVDHFIKSKKEDEEKLDKEKPLRSLIKAISWRVIGTLDTFLVSWIVSGNMSVAFSIGFVELFTKMLLYYGHERLWINIKWGK